MPNDPEEREQTQPLLNVAQGQSQSQGNVVGQGDDGGSEVFGRRDNAANDDVTKLYSSKQDANEPEDYDKPEKGDEINGDNRGNEVDDEGGNGQLQVEVASGDDLNKLYLAMDRWYQMSRLAVRYYYARHFWMMFLPSIAISMLSGILAFSIKSDLPVSEETKSWIAFYVGCASIFSVFLQNLSNELAYDHDSKSHGNFAVSLRALLDKVKKKSLTSEKCDKIQKSFDIIMQQNDATIPTQIVIAYDLASTRLGATLMPPMNYGTLNEEAKTAVGTVNLSEVKGMMNNELFVAFSSHWSFPLNLPDPEKMVDRALKKLRTQISVPEKKPKENMYSAILARQNLICESHKDHISGLQKSSIV